MGEQQIIISVSREYGSGGHEIAAKIAESLGLAFYDRNLLDEIAGEKQVDSQNLKHFDEQPRHWFLRRTVRGHSSSPEEIIAQMQFDYIRKRADSGESFVIVGRCAETVLKDYPGLVSIFIRGEKEHRIERIMNLYELNRKEAIAKIRRHDVNRKAYHNRYSAMRWGDSRYYDICINSSSLGVTETAQILLDFVKRKFARQ